MNFVFDIDGTICFDGNNIDKSIADKISKLGENCENRVIFATARPIRDAEHLVEQCIKNSDIIGGNGTIIKVEGITKTNVLLKKDAEKIYNFFSKENILIDYDWDYYFEGNTNIPFLNKIDPLKKAKCVKILSLNDILKIVIISDGNFKIDQLLEMCDSIEYTFYPKEKIHEFVKKNINKHIGIKTIIGDQDYVFFGNDINDIVALENAKLGYIVGDDIKIEGVENISKQEVKNILETYIP